VMAWSAEFAPTPRSTLFGVVVATECERIAQELLVASPPMGVDPSSTPGWLQRRRRGDGLVWR
jgi:hypothetical protein